jgi:hypothetical protein
MYLNVPKFLDRGSKLNCVYPTDIDEVGLRVTDNIAEWIEYDELCYNKQVHAKMKHYRLLKDQYGALHNRTLIVHRCNTVHHTRPFRNVIRNLQANLVNIGGVSNNIVLCLMFPVRQAVCPPMPTNCNNIVVGVCRDWVVGCCLKLKLGIAHLRHLMTQSIMHDFMRHAPGLFHARKNGSVPDLKIFETKGYDVVIYVAHML